MKFMCPFCGKVHKLNGFRNIFCSCEDQAKLYILSGYWLSRRNGKRVDLDFSTKYELSTWIAEHLDRGEEE